MFLPCAWQPTLLPNPDANSDPFLLFSVTSFWNGGGKWEPDALIHVATIPRIQLIMAISGEIIRRWEPQDSSSALCSVCVRIPRVVFP